MTYSKINFVDRQVSRPKTYTMTTNEDNTVTLTDSFGTVTNIGTPLNAENMNHIEDGITNSATTDLDNLSTTGQAVIDGKVSKAGDTMTGGLTVNGGVTTPQEMTALALEIGNGASGHGGFIDFHYNGSTADYTSRICEYSSGALTVEGTLTANSSISAGGEMRFPRLICTGNGINNNIDFSHTSKAGGAYINSDRFLGSDKWYEIMPIVATYVSGTSGYRIWADGYCEQWGAVTGSAGVAVTLLKTYKNNYYQITGNDTVLDSTASMGYHSIGFRALSGSKFTVHFTSGTTRVSWKTSGYLASGQY